MNVLALELSSRRGSIASGAVDISFPNDRQHSGDFFDGLQSLWRSDVLPERIVVGLGPGSYAGVRIAIATAVGLQCASGAELLGLPSLLAMNVEEDEYCVVGDARRQSFFFARVVNRVCVEGPDLCTERELRQRIEAAGALVVSTEPLPQFWQVEIALPSAAILARLSRDGASLPPLQPIYLRDPHITQPTR